MGSRQSRRAESYTESIKLLLLLPLFVFLLLTKFLFDKLEENNDGFYPDELNKCPPESYLLDDSERVKCLSCPQCPSGMESTPPCGTTLAVKLKGECVPCRTGTYSNSANSDGCKACTDCGSRETLISCTAERDAKCKQCPLFHFEDQKTNTCIHCNFCCVRNLSARLKCLRSKTCNATCTHTEANNSRSKILGLISQWKEKNRPVRSVQNDEDGVTKNDDENGEHEIDSKSFRYEGPEDIEDIQLSNIAIPDPIPQDQNSYFPVAQEKRKITPAANNPKLVSGTDQRKGLSISTTIKAIMQFLNGKENQLVRTTLPTQLPLHIPQVPTPLSPQSQLINLPLLLNSFAGTLLACAFLGIVFLVVYIVRKCIQQRSGDHKRLQGEKSLDQADLKDDLLEESITKDDEVSSKNEVFLKISEAAKEIEDLNLCDIPPDVEDVIIHSLETSRYSRGKSEMYGWKEVGIEAGMSSQDLMFYETEYRRPNGYPSKMILERLGGEGKTVSHLLNILKPRDRKVQPDSNEASIRLRVTEI